MGEATIAWRNGSRTVAGPVTITLEHPFTDAIANRRHDDSSDRSAVVPGRARECWAPYPCVGAFRFQCNWNRNVSSRDTEMTYIVIESGSGFPPASRREGRRVAAVAVEHVRSHLMRENQ